MASIYKRNQKTAKALLGALLFASTVMKLHAKLLNCAPTTVHWSSEIR